MCHVELISFELLHPDTFCFLVSLKLFAFLLHSAFHPDVPLAFGCEFATLRQSSGSAAQKLDALGTKGFSEPVIRHAAEHAFKPHINRQETPKTS